MSYVKKHKYHLIIFFVLLIVAGMSWYFGFKTQSDNRYQTTDSTTQTPNTNSQTPTKELQDTGYKLQVIPMQGTGSRLYVGTSSKFQDTNKTQTTNNKTQPQLPAFDPSSGRGFTNYQLLVTTTSTALEAMKTSGIDFKTKTFSGLGEFVEEIGGLKNDPQEGKYWIYFINGETAKLGISTQIVMPGDLIEWKYGTTNL